MVLKAFCDECGKELKGKENKVADRIKFISKTGHRFELICSNATGTWNDGHLCIKCIKKLISDAEEG